VADIEKGGVFAYQYHGVYNLLPDRVKGGGDRCSYNISFRGDRLL